MGKRIEDETSRLWTLLWRRVQVMDQDVEVSLGDLIEVEEEVGSCLVTRGGPCLNQSLEV